LTENRLFLEIFSKPISWLGMKKLNLVLLHKNKHKILKQGLVASYNIRPGNGGLFWLQRFIYLLYTAAIISQNQSSLR